MTERYVVFNKYTGAYLNVSKIPEGLGGEAYVDTLDVDDATVFTSYEEAQRHVDHENKMETGHPWMIGIPGVLCSESVRDFLRGSSGEQLAAQEIINTRARLRRGGKN